MFNRSNNICGVRKRSPREKERELMQKESSQHDDRLELEETHERRQPFCELDEEALFDMAELFKVFGDSTRIRILYAMFDEELRVSDICEELGMSISAVSHQLRLLKQAKLVRCRREGRMAYYMLADDHVKTIIGMAKEHIEE